MNWKTCLLAVAALAIGPALIRAGDTPRRPLKFEDLTAFKRVGEPMPSPDGKWVAFDAVEVNLDENTKRSHLWIVPAAGGESRRLNPGSNNDESRPRFSPDGKRLIFSSKAGDVPQVWITGFDAGAGALTGPPAPLTDLSTGAGGAIWSPDGRSVVFTSDVFPDAPDDAANKERTEALKKSKVKAQIFTHLFYRHWNAFTEFKRSHLFVVGVDPDPARTGVPGATPPPRDLTPGDHDVPPFSLGGADDYAISPDGRELAYASNVDEVEAASTNNEIFLVPLTGGEPRKISTSPGSDSTPRYSPDGKWLAWRSQARAGFESDKETLLVYDRAAGSLRDVTAKSDLSAQDFAWSPDSRAIFYTAEDAGQAPIFEVAVAPGGADHLPYKVAVGHLGDLAFAPQGDRLFFSRSTVAMPAEIGSVNPLPTRTDAAAGGGEPSGAGSKMVRLEVDVHAVTHVNAALLSQLDLPPLEAFTFTGAAGAQVQGFLLRPPGFDASKKYPLKFLIHGGPQGAWGDSWSYRWNPELFAASGDAVVVMVNPHGSTGYGQAFTDEVSGDWGGEPYEDLMIGLDYAEQHYPFIDKEREAALGASYGGYMIDWILGHTDRFKCLVTHDGMFDAVSAYGSTEELWFNEWEFKGTPWSNPETYKKWSPDEFVKNFKTPTLVVHGQLDYRLDVSQGFALFTTLQRLGVPSEMLYFPDEGHWVLKPQNSRLWNKTVNEWVARWVGTGGK